MSACKGPRKRIAVRLPYSLAVQVRRDARDAGLSVTEYVAACAQQEIARQEKEQGHN